MQAQLHAGPSQLIQHALIIVVLVVQLVLLQLILVLLLQGCILILLIILTQGPGLCLVVPAGCLLEEPGLATQAGRPLLLLGSLQQGPGSSALRIVLGLPRVEAVDGDWCAVSTSCCALCLLLVRLPPPLELRVYCSSPRARNVPQPFPCSCHQCEDHRHPQVLLDLLLQVRCAGSDVCVTQAPHCPQPQAGWFLRVLGSVSK
mmetsp:Transcript_13868/g.29930  ORF Transcript_13868/g.29930 Transcript_13868/m.29930 type:complete len:203 (-) Transcript_13868:480-1088(-)